MICRSVSVGVGVLVGTGDGVLVGVRVLVDLGVAMNVAVAVGSTVFVAVGVLAGTCIELHAETTIPKDITTLNFRKSRCDSEFRPSGTVAPHWRTIATVRTTAG